MTLGATPTIAQILAELGSAYSLPYTFPDATTRWLAGVGASDPITFPTSFANVTSIKTVTTASAGGSGNSHTFSGVSFGNAFSGRRLIACIGLHDGATGAARDQTSCTIGGISADGDDAGSFITGKTAGGGVWAAAVPTGTSGDVTINWSGNSLADVGLILLSASNLTLPAYDNTASWNIAGTGSQTGGVKSLNIPSNGVVIACICHANTNPVTLSGVTKQNEITFGGTATLTVGYSNRMGLESARNLDCSWVGATAWGGEARSFAQ